MQQTDKYKLNKPGVDDPIAIAPLNENMDKVEGALTALEGADAALEQSIMILEASKARIIVGTYTGNGAGKPNGQTIQLGTTPKAVIIPISPQHHYIAIEGKTVYDNSSGIDILGVVEGGFRVISGATLSLNIHGTTYYFLALV